jgi:hypothetical protein
MSQDNLPNLWPTVFTLRIILFALILGIVVFACVAIFMVTQNGPMAPNGDVFTWTMTVFAAPILLVQFVLPAFILNSTSKRILARQPNALDEILVAAYRSHLIIGWAMCEGAALSVLIAYLLEGNDAMLVIAAIAIALMVIRLPSERGLAAWLERQRDSLWESSLER